MNNTNTSKSNETPKENHLSTGEVETMAGSLPFGNKDLLQDPLNIHEQSSGKLKELKQEIADYSTTGPTNLQMLRLNA